MIVAYELMSGRLAMVLRNYDKSYVGNQYFDLQLIASWSQVHSTSSSGRKCLQRSQL
jgi:hypothetical protein